MKYIIRNFSFCFLFIVLAFSSANAQSIFRLKNTSPYLGQPGDTITINGYNLDTSNGNYQLRIGGIQIPIISISDTSIKTILPHNTYTDFIYLVDSSKNQVAKTSHPVYRIHQDTAVAFKSKPMLMIDQGNGLKFWDKTSSSVTQTLDINADGLLDIIVRKNQVTNILINKISKDWKLEFDTLSLLSSGLVAHEELNGKGLAELSMWHSKGLMIYQIDTLNGIVQLSDSFLLDQHRDYLFDDLNGDGKSDAYRYAYRLTSPVQFGIEYRLNRSSDTLSFDTTVFLEMGSTSLNIIDYTDSNTVIAMGKTTSSNFQILEIFQDTVNLNYRRLLDSSFAGISTFNIALDINYDGTKELFTHTSGNKKRIFKYDTAGIKELGHYISYIQNISPLNLLATQNDSAVYRITTLLNTQRSRTTMRLKYSNDSVQHDYIDTIDNKFFSSVFGDFNGDGYVDVLSKYDFNIYPSKVFKIGKSLNTDTINFLYDSIGHQIYEHNYFIVNQGVETVKIDSFTSQQCRFLNKDSSTISLPYLLKPNDTLIFAIQFTGLNANHWNEQTTIHLNATQINGPYIRSKKNTNPNFSISQIIPSEFSPGDSIKIICKKYRGISDSTFVFFRNTKAKVYEVKGDTIYAIAPSYYSNSKVVVIDAKHALINESKKAYSMLHYKHKSLPIDRFRFEDVNTYYGRGTLGVPFPDHVMDDIVIRSYSGSKGMDFFRSLPKQDKYVKVGNRKSYQSQFIPLLNDDKIDYLTWDNGWLYFIQNKGNTTDTFPFQWDTLASTKLSNYVAVNYLDLDNDGSKDLVSYQNSIDGRYLLIQSSQFDNTPYHFGQHYQIPIARLFDIQFHDVNNDGLDDLIVFSDSTIKLYLNNSRLGMINFKFHDQLARQNQSSSYRIHKAIDINQNNELLLAESYLHNKLLFNKLSFPNGKLKMDTLWSETQMGTITTAKVTCEDIDGNSSLDLLIGRYLYLNESDSSGIKFSNLINTHASSTGSLMDMNGDHFLDMVGQDYVHLNLCLKMDVWSELEKAHADASVPSNNDYVEEPAIIISQDTSKFSEMSPIYLANLGLVSIEITEILLPPNIQISDSTNFQPLQLPITIDSSSVLRLIIRSNNQQRDSAYRDIMHFIFDGRFDLSQELIHLIQQPPIIEQISPLRPMIGDTVHVIGNNLINPNGNDNLLRVKDRVIEPIFSSDTLYQFLFPAQMGNCRVSLFDTLNRLSGTSDQQLVPLRQGLGGKITLKYFKLDTILKSKTFGSRDNPVFPYYDLDFVDLNQDGELDILGKTRSYNGSSSTTYGRISYDKAPGPFNFDITNAYSLSASSNGYSTFPKALRTSFGDANNDGILDLFSIDDGGLCTSPSLCYGASIVSTKVDSTFRYFRNEPHTRYFYTGRYDKRSGTACVFNDFNKDGIIDVLWRRDSTFLITSYSDYYTWSVDPSGNQTVLNKSINDTIYRKLDTKSGFRQADIDGDGKMDLIDGGRIYLNESDSFKFKFRIAYDIVDTFNYCAGSPNPRRSMSTSVVYLNKDGKPDLFATGLALCGASGHKVALINESTPGKVKFKSKVFHEYGASYYFTAHGDINGDGLTDFIGMTSPFFTSHKDSLYIYTNKTDTSFKYEIEQIYFKNPTDVIIYDIDGNGAEDMLISSIQNSQVQYHIYRNNALSGQFSKQHVNFTTPELSIDSTTIRYTNTGALSLSIDTLIFTNHNPNLSFKILKGTSGKHVLKSDSFITIKLVYKGDSLGTILDSIFIKHNGPSGGEFVSISATTLPWPRVDVLYDTLDFGSIRIGDTVRKSYTIYNVGTDSLRLTGWSSSNSEFRYENVNNQKAEAGDSISIQIKYTPFHHRNSNTNSFVTHNGASNRINIYLKGDGIAPIIAKRMNRNLGSYPFNQKNIDSFYIHNTGNDTLRISQISAGQKLKFISLQKTIAPADSQLIKYELLVNQYGNYEDSILLKHDYFKDSSSSIIVKYTGLRGDAVHVNSLAFDPTKIDHLDSNTLNFINKGNANLKIDSIRFTNTNIFKLGSVYTYPIIIKANDTSKIKVLFEPNKNGVIVANMVLHHNGISDSSTITLHGSAIADLDSARVLTSKKIELPFYNYSNSTVNISNTYSSNISLFEIDGLKKKNILANDSLKGSLEFRAQKEKLSSESGSIQWNGLSTNLKFIGFGISPEIIAKEVLNLASPDVGKRKRDTLWVKNTGTDTLFVNSYKSSSQIEIIDSFKQILAGDSGRIIFDYWTNLRILETESIELIHNYYKNNTTILELNYFGVSPGIFMPTAILDFGKKSVTGTYKDSFYIKNTGNVDLILDSLINFGDDILKGLNIYPLVIPANQRKFIPAQFKPLARKQYQTDLWIYHNAQGDSLQFRLKGKGISNLPDSLVQLDTQRSSINTKLIFSYYLHNRGDELLKIDSIRSKNSNVQILSHLNSILPFDSIEVKASFTPNKLSVAYDSHFVYHNHHRYNKSTIIIPFKGTDAVGQLNPQNINHGYVSQGQSITRSFTLKNIGEEDLNINFSVFKKGTQFKLKTDPKGTTIKPGDSILLETIYTPTNNEIDYDTIDFWNNSKTWKNDNKVYLVGRLKAGSLEIENTPLLIGNTKLNQPLKGQINVINKGTDTLKIISITSATEPNIIFDLPTNQTLDTNKREQIRFIYNNKLKKDTSLIKYTITHTGINSPTLGVIELNTIWPELKTSDSFVFNDTEIKTVNEDTFWLFNTGTDTLRIENILWKDGVLFDHISSPPIEILPGDSSQLILEYSPNKIGHYSDSISFESNDSSEVPYKRLVSGLAIKTGSISDMTIISGIKLYQNIPNPSNQKTSIAFELMESQIASLKLYDYQGRLVKELFQGRAASGINSISFSTTHLAEGIYHYRLEVEGVVLQKSLIISH